MEEKLKDLKNILDSTIFKEKKFNYSSADTLRSSILKKKKKLYPPVLISAAVLLMLIFFHLHVKKIN